jgi:hypothetical protein
VTISKLVLRVEHRLKVDLQIMLSL